ncbi:MAG: outer membrane protein assembly factor BamB [Sulfurifustis sp.]
MTRKLALLVALAVSGCASHVVREPPAALVSFKSSYDVKEQWSANVGAKSVKGALRLTPGASDGFVYAADPRGRVSAFAEDSGRKKWSVDLHTPVSGAVGVSPNLVLVGTRNGEVIALDRENGNRLWAAPVSSEVLAAPAANRDVVVAQAVDGRVYALAADTGKRLWVYERTEPALSLRGTGTPVVLSDGVLAGFASGKLVALRLKDGGVLWEATVGQPHGRNEIERLVDVDASALVSPDAVYAASFQGKLTALSPGSGAILWARDVSTYTALAMDEANIYLTDDKSRVLALDRKTGASVWTQEGLHGRRLSAPVVYRDSIVVADYEGYVHWLARDDGHFVARYRVGRGPVRAPAAVDNETLFILATSGKLAALRLVSQ